MKSFGIDHLQEIEISQLWCSTLKGDRESFQKLMEATYDLMFQFGHKFSRDRELIKDSIQDVFLEILEKRTRLSSDIPPKPYLLASLRRRLHRLEQRQRWMVPGDTETTGFEIEFSSEHYLILSEETGNIARQMTSLMNELPERQKEVVYLRFFQNLDRDEIADLMRIRPQSVSNLLQAAFKWLRTQWKPVISLLLPSFLC
jgi:RNA polymerase sigma factor (sigma-70 family)